MSKGKIAVFVLLLIAVASIAVWWIMSDNAKDKKVQQEIDAVVKVLDDMRKKWTLDIIVTGMSSASVLKN